MDDGWWLVGGCWLVVGLGSWLVTGSKQRGCRQATGGGWKVGDWNGRAVRLLLSVWVSGFGFGVQGI